MDSQIRFRFDEIPHRRLVVENETPLLITTDVKVQRPKLNTYEIINYIAACAHLAQSVLTVFPEQSASIPIEETYIDWRDTGSAGNCTGGATATINDFSLVPTREVTHELSLKWLIVAFHGLSFLFELFATDPLFGCSRGNMFAEWRRNYVKRVDSGTNYIRFVEYSASASVMLIAIALTTGIWDSYSLIGIGFLTFATMVFGGVAEQLFSDDIPKMEREPRRGSTMFLSTDYPLTYRLRKIAWYSHFAGWFTMLSAYGIIIRNFVFSNMNSQSSAPDFVWAIVFGIFALYNVFGVVQLVQLAGKTTPNIIFPKWLGGPCEPVDLGQRSTVTWNRNIEMAYVINSLVSKTLLGLLIYFNVIVGERTVC
jgi:hypothetical protein